MVLLLQGIFLLLLRGLKRVTVQATLLYKNLVVNFSLQNKIFHPSM